MKRKFKRIIISIVSVISLILVGTLSASAQSGYSYAFGGEFFLPEYGYDYEDIKQVATYAALMNYHSYYNADLTYSYVNSQRINSDLTYFSCHGDSNGLYFPTNGLTISRGSSNGSNVIGLSSWTLSNNKLMVFDACSTAAGSSNICTTAISRGANCVIGWTKVISTESYDWLKRFYNRLATGNTITASVNYADSFNDYSSDSNLKNHIIYGDGSQVLKRSSLSATSELNDVSTIMADDPRERTIPEISFNYNCTDYSILESAIQVQFPDFDLTNYQVNVSSTSQDNTNFVVDFNEIVNGCWTSSGFTMIFTNEKTNIVYDNTVEQSKSYSVSSSSIKVSDVTISSAKAEAVTLVNPMEEVKMQKGEVCYDKGTNTYFYRVYTTFGPKGTDYQRVMVYNYPLS